LYHTPGAVKPPAPEPQSGTLSEIAPNVDPATELSHDMSIAPSHMSLGGGWKQLRRKAKLSPLVRYGVCTRIQYSEPATSGKVTHATSPL